MRAKKSIETTELDVFGSHLGLFQAPILGRIPVVGKLLVGNLFVGNFFVGNFCYKASNFLF